MQKIKLKTNYPIDLHCHTSRSDGADSPKELVDHAVELGMKIIAITDHDIRPPEIIEVDGRKCDIADYAVKQGIILLKGIEISCETTVEDCHIVCLGCDWSDPYFVQLEVDTVQSKVQSYRELIKKLNQRGMNLTWDEILDNNGRPIVQEKIQKKMIFELLARKGYTKDWSEAKLLIKNNVDFQIQRKKPDPCDVILQAHRCGGIAILAHPYLINERPQLNGISMSREAYIEYLIEAGLDGIEVCYPYEKTSYAGTLKQREIETEVRDKYNSCLNIFSGGSDYHADSKKGTKNIRELGECGLTEEEFYSNYALKKIMD